MFKKNNAETENLPLAHITGIPHHQVRSSNRRLIDVYPEGSEPCKGPTKETDHSDTPANYGVSTVQQ